MVEVRTLIPRQGVRATDTLADMIRRGFIIQPAPVPLGFMMLAWLAPSVSLIGVGLFCLHLILPTYENWIPLKLLPSGSVNRLPNQTGSPEIFIREDDEVFFDGQGCDTGLHSQRLDSLRSHIRAQAVKKHDVSFMIYVEAEARYNRIVDVLNALAACNSYWFHLVIMSEKVGP